MNNSKNIEDIKVALQKLAADIPSGNPAGAPMGNSPSTPQEVMDLIDQAIDLLENAQGGIPASKGGEASANQPAPVQTAAEKAPETVTPGEGLTDDKKKSIQKTEPRVSGSGEGEKPNPSELIARIAALEEELEKKKKEEVGMEYAKLFPEEIRQAKFDEMVKSNDSIDTLTMKYQAAKEVSETTVKIATQTPNHNSYTNLGSFRKASQNTSSVPEWRF